MKRLLLIATLAILVCSTGYGWGRREHATVAQIAENHLTPKAKKLITKYPPPADTMWLPSRLVQP